MKLKSLALLFYFATNSRFISDPLQPIYTTLNIKATIILPWRCFLSQLSQLVINVVCCLLEDWQRLTKGVQSHLLPSINVNKPKESRVEMSTRNGLLYFSSSSLLLVSSSSSFFTLTRNEKQTWHQYKWIEWSHLDSQVRRKMMKRREKRKGHQKLIYWTI